MYCVKRIKDDLFWVGGTDRRLALFENAFPIPRGISYNAYLLLDEKTVLFDTCLLYTSYQSHGAGDLQPEPEDIFFKHGDCGRDHPKRPGM